MPKDNESIDNLSNKIELLHARQIEINIEFENLKKEIDLLKTEDTDSKKVLDLSKPTLVEEITQPIEVSKPTDYQKKKHIRIGAMLLFAITLIKLVFYDLSHLETIPKAIVFVLLGVLLLIISFLYNKFKHFIADEN